MRNNWSTQPLSEIVEMVKDKVETKDFEVSLSNYISTENMLPERGGVVDASNLPNQTKFLHFKKNDILFSNIRTYFKKVWYAHFEGVASNDVIVFRPKNGELDSGFLYYCLSSDKFIDYTVTTSKGTKMPRGDRSAISQYAISYPPLQEQKAIAHILGSLDDKIELNRKMNETLEQMAQALFKSWFVDFDPVIDNALAAGNPIPEALQAKAEKRRTVIAQNAVIASEAKQSASQSEIAAATVASAQPNAQTAQGLRNDALPQHLRQLFPASFTFTEALGWIPEGWEAKKLGDISALKYGKMPKKEKLGQGDYITYSGYKYIEKYPEMNCKKDTLIVVARGVGGTGDIKMTERDCFLTNLSIMINTKHYNKYLFYLLRPKGLKYLDSGSAQSQITINDLSQEVVYVPSDNLISAFENFEVPLNQKRIDNINSSQTLSTLRDTLLPKLISGELRVGEGEEVVQTFEK